MDTLWTSEYEKKCSMKGLKASVSNLPICTCDTMQDLPLQGLSNLIGRWLPTSNLVVVVVYPLPWPLLVGGVRCSRLRSTSQLIRPSGQQCSHSGGVCPQIQGRQCGAYVGAVEEMMCVWMLQRGHSGDGCVLASTLCKYDLRKGDLFVLSWARERRVRRGSISSELLVCGGGVRSILLLPLVARCLETIDVYGACLFLCLL